jgi:beta-xylosidase
MKRLIAVLILLASAGLTNAADGTVIPDGATGAPMSCPDPSVLDAHAGRFRYYLVCTSDYQPDAFPIRGSNDLFHWHLLGHVLPAGAQPWWALPSPVGRYWAPSLYRIRGRWVVYFAAQYDASKLTLRFPDGYPQSPGTMVIGVATANSLTGPWRTAILHYRGQFNRVNAEHESYGGVIDPSMVRDPRTGQMYLLWAEQHSSIWIGKLSAGGTRLAPHIHQALWAAAGWECASVRHVCTVEGPVAAFRGGWFYLFYSGASTWDGSYAVGTAVSNDPMHRTFKRLGTQPLLHSGHGWVATGGSSAPVTGPGGRSYVFYHGSRGANPGHVSADRYLLASPIDWTGVAGYYPLVAGGAG